MTAKEDATHGATRRAARDGRPRDDDHSRPARAAERGGPPDGRGAARRVPRLCARPRGASRRPLGRRWGVPLVDGGTVRLPAVVGLGRALDLILTGRPVDAREAERIGLANRVVAHGKAREEAHALALRIAGFPPNCVRSDRQSAYESL